MLGEMPMDDATASDNCGEVTIEVSSETTAGDLAGNYTIVRTFTATDDAGNSTFATQTITVQDTTAPEFTFVPADYTVECSDEMPMDDATASDNYGEVTIKCPAKRPLEIRRQLHHHAHVHRHRRCWKQFFGHADHHGPGHHGASVHVLARGCHRGMHRRLASGPSGSRERGTFTLTVQVDTLPGLCGDLVIVQRTFTATDDAGNVNVAVQTLTQVDTQVRPCWGWWRKWICPAPKTSIRFPFPPRKMHVRRC